MTDNITITFTECVPTPANGYNIQYRVVGSGSALIDAGNFSSSPAVITVSYPDGTLFEGIIRTDCGAGVFGPAVAWGGEVVPPVEVESCCDLIEKTVVQMQSLQASSTFIPGRFYKIIDAPDTSQIILQAISTNELAEGTRRFLCPADYAVEVDVNGNDWIGVWNATKSATIGQLTIWGGKVWINISGGIGGPDDDFTLNGADWTLISKATFANGEYVPMVFGVRYDVVNDWIERQWDGSGNMFGVDFETENFGGYGFASAGTNMVDVADWNQATSGFPFYNNTCLSVYNNSNNGGVYFNATLGLIFNNMNNGAIYFNRNKGNIFQNSNGGVVSANYNDGTIWNNSNTIDIIGNGNGGAINVNSNTGEIAYNKNSAFISSNTSTGSIHFNDNSGSISDNSNGGDISSNHNGGDISVNSNNSFISFNVNTGAVGSNSNTGVIANNTNNGSIGDNSNGGSIEFNSNNGSIGSNSNSSFISQNSNNGPISTIGSANSTIRFNINNGSIATTTAGSISDTIVNK